MAIALLRHREADDAHGRIAHGAEQRLRILGRDEEAAQRADDAQALAVAGAYRERVEAVLRRERVARLRRAQARAADRPVALAGGEPVVDVDGLMGAVEGADAEMHDADADGVEIVARTVDAGRKL